MSPGPGKKSTPASQPLKSGLRPPTKVKSNKYDHRNHSKNSSGVMDSMSSGSEDECNVRNRQPPRRRKPKPRGGKDLKGAPAKGTQSDRAEGQRVQHEGQTGGRARSLEKSFRSKGNEEAGHEDDPSPAGLRGKGRVQHPGRLVHHKPDFHGSRLATPASGHGVNPNLHGHLPKPSKQTSEVITPQSKCVAITSSEVKPTPGKVNRDMNKPVHITAKCKAKSTSNSALNYGNKAKPQEANSSQRLTGNQASENTCYPTENNPSSSEHNGKTKDCHISTSASKHSKLKPPTVGCSIPKPALRVATKARNQVDSTMGGHSLVAQIGAIPIASDGQMNDIIVAHPECPNNQTAPLYSTDGLSEPQPSNQEAEGQGTGEQFNVPCSQVDCHHPHYGDNNSNMAMDDSSEIPYCNQVKSIEGKREGSQVLEQEETNSAIASNVIANVAKCPQRDLIMMGNNTVNKDSQRGSNITAQLQTTNQSKLPTCDSQLDSSYRESSENKAIVSGSSPSGAALNTLSDQLGKSVEDCALDNGPGVKLAACDVNGSLEAVVHSKASVSTCNDSDEILLVGCRVCPGTSPSSPSPIDISDSPSAAVNGIQSTHKSSGADPETDALTDKQAGTIDYVVNNAKSDAICVMGRANNETLFDSAPHCMDSISNEGHPRDSTKTVESVSELSKAATDITQLRSNKRESCNQVNVIGPVQGNIRTDGFQVCRLMQNSFINGGLSSNHAASLHGLNGSSIDRDLNDNLQNQSINSVVPASAGDSSSAHAGDGLRTLDDINSQGLGARVTIEPQESEELLREGSIIEKSCSPGKVETIVSDKCVYSEHVCGSVPSPATISNEFPMNESCPLPGNSVEHMSCSDGQIEGEICRTQASTFCSKCVAETKQCNCDPASHDMKTNDPIRPDSCDRIPARTDQNAHELNKSDSCPATKAKHPTSQESHNNAVNGQLLKSHCSGNQGIHPLITTSCDSPESQLQFSNNSSEDAAITDVATGNCDNVSLSAAMLATRSRKTQPEGQISISVQESHGDSQTSSTSEGTRCIMNGNGNPPKGGHGNYLPPDHLNDLHQACTLSGTTMPGQYEKSPSCASHLVPCNSGVNSGHICEQIESQEHIEGDGNISKGRDSNKMLQDLDGQNQLGSANVIEFEIEYSANSPTTPKATEMGPIDFDRSKHEETLASSLATSDLLSESGIGSIGKIEDPGLTHASDAASDKLETSDPRDTCIKPHSDGLGPDLDQKQQDCLLDSFTEFDSGFVQSPPECSEAEEYASTPTDVCQNSIASIGTCQGMGSEVPQSIAQPGASCNFNTESKFSSELRMHQAGSNGHFENTDSNSLPKSNAESLGVEEVYQNDVTSDLESSGSNQVKSPQADVIHDDKFKTGTEHGNICTNMASDLFPPSHNQCDIHSNANHNSACFDADKHGSQGPNPFLNNLNQKTMEGPNKAETLSNNMLDSGTDMGEKSVSNLNESEDANKNGLISKMAAETGAEENETFFFLSDDDEYENTYEDTLEAYTPENPSKGSMSDFEDPLDQPIEEDPMTCSSTAECKNEKVPARSASSPNFQRKWDPEKRKAKYGIAAFLMESAPLHRATATSSLNVKSETDLMSPTSENPTLQFPKFKDAVVSQTSLHTSYYEDNTGYLNMMNCLNGKNLRRDNSDPCYIAKVGQSSGSTENVTNDIEKMKNEQEMKELLENIHQLTAENNNHPQSETNGDEFSDVRNSITSEPCENNCGNESEVEPKSILSDLTGSASDNNMMVSSTCSSASSQMDIENSVSEGTNSEFSCSESVKSVTTTPTSSEPMSLALKSLPQSPVHKSKIPGLKSETLDSKKPKIPTRIPKPGGAISKDSGIPKKVKATSFGFGLPSIPSTGSSSPATGSVLSPPIGITPKSNISAPTTIDVSFRKPAADGATSPRIDEGYGTLQSSPKKVRFFIMKVYPRYSINTCTWLTSGCF